MDKFYNLNDETVWTLEDMKELRGSERINGIYIYDNFEDWLENKLEMDFERI